MIPWLRVNQTRQLVWYAVPIPSFVLRVHRGSIPGAPKAEFGLLLSPFDSFSTIAAGKVFEN